MKYILAIDQGTTSTRVILFNERCKSQYVEQREFESIFPEPGWVEQDPNMIYNDIVAMIKSLLEKSQVSKSDIAAVGITNQRETTTLWDKRDGRIIHNSIVWQSKQSTRQCDELQQKGLQTVIKEKTGLLINPYFSCSKIMWLFENVPEAKKLADEGNLYFGTIDTWIIYKLTGGKVHATDVSNAARTMLFNIYELHWDEEILDECHIPKSILPDVKSSSCDFGTITDIPELAGVKITGVAGDQQSSLYGHGAKVGGCKATYGTGCFVVKNAGKKLGEIPKGLLGTIGWKVGDQVTYAIEGSVMTAGAALRWIRDMGILKEYNEITEILPENNGGVYFVPAFQGLGTPYWDDDVRGMIVGLTSGTTRGHLVRATLESIALQCSQVIDIMGVTSEIKVDGGVSKSDMMLQFQADICGKKVVRLKEKEITAMGVAMLAGIAVGLFKESELDEMREVERVFEPSMSHDEVQQIFLVWNKAVAAARHFVH
ncbi:glycerol kinase, putative [Entamoeba invadens IP1]|uniref:glycerol kinase n=1 Tax=Entamoeba invadens IP1 TaxID=370355 RepID=A0A0A1TUM3_ENTIV|nr:glycerol kinase, putative [Entamoeba invadens IP1]ELP83749.1 glycerol kinase, putative [Entamoeba invadens IP1]|eukprot:XP_004183095.1 glycerol kinase, putative [Entamoeba invadens IP1]